MKHNFCAGPAVLPQEVIEKSAKAVYDFAGTGISILSISHRSSEFKPVVDGWAAGVGDGYACEFQAALERTLQEELSIAGVAREDIDNLAVLIVGIGINAIETLTLHQFDVRAAVAKVSHKATDVVCNGDGSRIAIENNLHGVVLYGTHGKGACYAGDDAYEKLSHRCVLW